MRKRLILSLAAMALYVGGLFAQQNIIAPQNRVASSFAIFIDDKSYEACKEAVMAYKNLLEEEGLATYLLVAEWQDTEHVKYFLEKYYKEQAMEGAVFIGNIPIAMIRKAQHMTSAFKMDEKMNMRASSVPSDRFYDDDPDSYKKWAKMGILGVEMEAADLYMNAAQAGKRALAICTVSDHIIRGESLDSDARQTTFTDMMTIALNVAASMQ